MSAFSGISSLLSFSSTEHIEALVESLLTCIEARDATLRRHSERVARYSDHIALAFDLDTEARQQLVLGSLLHDIGNIGIPDSILLKPTGLTKWEFNEMRLHPIIGEQICRPLGALFPALPLIRSHHEKLDGSGYPDGLKGDEISLVVRILSVTDVYDTLRCERAYRDAFTHEQALEILEGEAARGWWDTEIIARLGNVTAPESDFVPV
ncbi:HD domain-containing protein [bacterium]|nr:MAG: HD domain-containing protein [bacterium]